jgi:hypothetical protein
MMNMGSKMSMMGGEMSVGMMVGMTILWILKFAMASAAFSAIFWCVHNKVARAPKKK